MCDISKIKNYLNHEWKDKCVRCGYCCSRGPCRYSVYDANKPYKCIFLENANKELGTFSCTIRDDIMDREKKSSTPMFDNYCSSSMFNFLREEVIRKQKMINIRQLSDKDIGRYVFYTNSVGNQEIGRLKSWNYKWIFVVYNCAEDWDNFKNYTATATDPCDLMWEQ